MLECDHFSSCRTGVRPEKVSRLQICASLGVLEKTHHITIASQLRYSVSQDALPKRKKKKKRTATWAKSRQTPQSHALNDSAILSGRGGVFVVLPPMRPCVSMVHLRWHLWSNAEEAATICDGALKSSPDAFGELRAGEWDIPPPGPPETLHDAPPTNQPDGTMFPMPHPHVARRRLVGRYVRPDSISAGGGVLVVEAR